MQHPPQQPGVRTNLEQARTPFWYSVTSWFAGHLPRTLTPRLHLRYANLMTHLAASLSSWTWRQPRKGRSPCVRVAATNGCSAGASWVLGEGAQDSGVLGFYVALHAVSHPLGDIGCNSAPFRRLSARCRSSVPTKWYSMRTGCYSVFRSRNGTGSGAESRRSSSHHCFQLLLITQRRHSRVERLHNVIGRSTFQRLLVRAWRQ